MTPQQKKFGVWHGPKWHGSSGMWNCSICETWTHGIPACVEKGNPDFTSEAGRVKLLKLMWELPELPEFLHKNYHGYVYSLVGFIKELTDDTGLFRDAVYKWLGGTEEI